MKLHRRNFLTLAMGSAALGMTKSSYAAPHEWRNWSGNQSHSAPIHYPTNSQEVAGLLKTLPGTIRAVGGSHSFSPLIKGADNIISLERMAGMLSVDKERHVARYGGGTRLMMASSQAWEQGFSFTNEPDINLQSLAGAIATSTHGTGSNLPSLSGQIESLTLITPNGETLNLSEKDGDIFRAACCNVGALGIITEIAFKHEPAYYLIEKTRVMSLRDAMDYCENNHDKVRHLEFYAFPRGNTAIVISFEISEKPVPYTPAEDANETLEWACELTMKRPWLIPVVQRALRFFVSNSERGGPSNLVYGNVRAVPFNEMEYTVPLKDGITCIDEVCHHYRKNGLEIFFPMEFRYVAADSSLISMFGGQAGASISVHQYAKMPYQKDFDSIEPIFHKYGGRPHWGKLHSLGYRELAALYPEYEKFCAIRTELDPDNRLANPHIRKLFGKPS